MRIYALQLVKRSFTCRQETTKYAKQESGKYTSSEETTNKLSQKQESTQPVKKRLSTQGKKLKKK